MKRFLTTIICILIAFGSSAQLSTVAPINNLGEVKRGGYLICKITYEKKGKFNLIYSDAAVRDITVLKSVSFTANDEELLSLRTIFKDQFGSPKNSNKEFQLGDSLFKLLTKRSFGQSYLEVYVSGVVNAGYFVLFEKELDSLMPQ